jgi:hypothetical protein
VTDRLSALLHHEVDRLEVPAPPVRESLAQGRRLRRRRRLTQAVAVAAVVATVGAGTALLTGGDTDQQPSDDSRIADSSSQGGAPADLGPVFSLGDTVYLDGGNTRVQMKEYVQAMYYTSGGLLLRTNKDGASDGGAPFHFALVNQGSVQELGLTLGEVVPSTDPGAPYLAYADSQDGITQVVVHDVTTDEEVARVDLPGEVSPGGGWSAPPVALDGDLVYVGQEAAALVVNWRTGEVSDTDATGAYPVVQSGFAVDTDGNDTRVVDLETGEAVITVPGYASVKVSPTGRYATVAGETATDAFDLYELRAGTKVSVSGQAWDFGWTGGDELYAVTGEGLVECSTADGTCVREPLPDGVRLDDQPRLPGQTFES